MTDHRYTLEDIESAAAIVGLGDTMTEEILFEVQRNTLIPTADEQAKIDAFGIDHPEEVGPGSAALAQAARGPFEFSLMPDRQLGLAEIVGQAVGAGSTCWVDRVTAEGKYGRPDTVERVFDSARAQEVVEVALAEIQKILAQTWQEGVNYGRHSFMSASGDDAANPHLPL